MGKVDCVTEACNESYHKGIEQGIHKTKIEIAISMLKDSYSFSEISRITGLSLDEVTELKRLL